MGLCLFVSLLWDVWGFSFIMLLGRKRFGWKRIWECGFAVAHAVYHSITGSSRGGCSEAAGVLTGACDGQGERILTLAVAAMTGLTSRGVQSSDLEQTGPGYCERSRSGKMNRVDAEG